MRDFFLCLLYYAAIGVVAQLIGTALPREWFHPERFPYRPYRWEKEGAVYQKIGIQHWKDRVPDMSKLDKRMVRKAIPIQTDSAKIYRLVQETCVAEMVHWLLCVAGLWGLRLFGGWPGVVLWLFYAVFLNITFVLIQRYNRPRLLRLYRSLQRREMRRKACES